jgi:cytochrome P450
MTVDAKRLSAPSCDIDFYSSEVIADPPRAYKRMLEAGPVVWLTAQSLHAVCGYDAVARVLRDHRGFSSAEGVSINDDVNAFLKGSTLNSDPPEHDRTRAITFAPLTPKALQDVRDKIDVEAEFIANMMTAQVEFDAASELAPHVPLSVVRDLVGLGNGGYGHMLEWGAATFELMGDSRERRGAAEENLANLRSFLDDPDTMNGLTVDGWARKATERGIADGLEEAHAKTLMRDYIAPSLDTTISAIGYGIQLFAQHPEQWDMLRNDRGLVKNAIEEIVRLNTPIRAFTRMVMEDTELGNVDLKNGERVLVVYGAANRDPRKFQAPDRFDIARETRGHMGFGHGVHTCLGMHLARLEMTSLFNALADKIKRFELTGPVLPAANATIYAHSSVPVRAIT